MSPPGFRRLALAVALVLTASGAGNAEPIAADWPEPARKAAAAIAEKYGPPLAGSHC